MLSRAHVGGVIAGLVASCGSLALLRWWLRDQAGRVIAHAHQAAVPSAADVEPQELTTASPAVSPPAAEPGPVQVIQAAVRGWSARRALGPRAQSSCYRGGCSVAIRVCGANACCQRGSERALTMIEDLVPPGAAMTGNSPCLSLCGMGPNVACTWERHAKKATFRRLHPGSQRSPD